MLSGATPSAFAIVGTAVFRIVVSSDSMKNATATSQGNTRFADAPGAAGGATAFDFAGIMLVPACRNSFCLPKQLTEHFVVAVLRNVEVFGNRFQWICRSIIIPLVPPARAFASSKRSSVRITIQVASRSHSVYDSFLFE